MKRVKEDADTIIQSEILRKKKLSDSNWKQTNGDLEQGLKEELAPSVGQVGLFPLLEEGMISLHIPYLHMKKFVFQMYALYHTSL